MFEARWAITAWVSKHRRLMLTGIVLALYLIGLGRPPLWEPDEGRYAEIAREMVTSHDYVTPHNNFVRYLEKPPLVYWVTAASLKLLGQNEFAVRFQAALASVGEVAITCALGETMFGATTGVLGGVALALSPLFFAFARFATPDPALAFFITASMACFYAGTRSVGVARSVYAGWMVAAAAMLAFGTLTKGPVALLLGGTIALLWLLFERRWRAIFQLPWLRCVGIYLVLVLPWFVVVALRNPGFARFFIVHEHFQRYLESTEHGWGPWFYIPVTIAGTWPWFYFVPFAMLPLWGVHLRSMPGVPQEATQASASISGANKGYIDSEDESTRPALHFLVIWFAVVFIFFSIPRSKLGEYILPGLPPIGILAAHGLTRLKSSPTLQRQRLFLLFAAINVAAASAIAVASLVTPAGAFTVAVSGDVRIIAIGLLVGGILAVVFAHRAMPVLTMALAASVLIEMGAAINARERIAPLVSYRSLARIIAPYAKRGCRLMSYRHFVQALPFYTGAGEILVIYRGELQPFGPIYDPSGNVFATTSQLKKMWAANQCIVLVANRSDLSVVAKLLSPIPIVVGCEGKKVALRNRTVSTPAQEFSPVPGCKNL